MLDFWPPNTFLVFSQRNTLWHAIPVAHNTSTDDILKTLGQQLGPPCRNPADLWMSPSQPSWGMCVCVGGRQLSRLLLSGPHPSRHTACLPCGFPRVSGVQNCALITGGVICRQPHQSILPLLLPEEKLKMRMEGGSGFPLPWPDTEYKDHWRGSLIYRRCFNHYHEILVEKSLWPL